MVLPILRRPALHTSAFYIAYFMATGVHLPFWPLWLADWGLSAGEIGLFVALGIAVRVGAGFMIPAVADRLAARRHSIAVCALVCMVAFLAHLAIDERAPLLVATLVIGVGFAGIGPIAEALGVAASKHFAFPYSQARGIGSLGFLLSNLAVGALIARFGSGVALWWIVGCLILMVVLVARHPGGRRTDGQEPPDFGEIFRLLLNPTFALFTVAVALVQGSHAVLYAYGSIHWRELGLGGGVIGALWAFSVAAEVVFLVVAGTRAVLFLGPVRALVVSGVAGVLRWGMMMGDPAGWLLWPLQALHVLTFALGHIGAVAFIAQAVPARYGAAAQGAAGSMGAGLTLALGMLAAAALYPMLGGATYVLGVAFSAAGLVAALALGRNWRGSALPV